MVRLRIAPLFVCLSLFAQDNPGRPGVSAPETPEVRQSREELARIEQLVESGGLPKARLEQAREAVADAQDAATLRHTLYGSPGIENLNDQLCETMIEAATRRLTRSQQQVDHARHLIEIGVASLTSLTPFLEDLDDRRRTLDLAESRSRLYRHLAEIARAEATAQAQQDDQSATSTSASHNPGDAALTPRRLRDVETAFENQFHRALPISANGETPFHRSLGFDHRGRVDVAVNPDEDEGKWLRKLLEAAHIPYLAFRGYVPGQASAAHIHIGPPSNKLRTAD